MSFQAILAISNLGGAEPADLFSFKTTFQSPLSELLYAADCIVLQLLLSLMKLSLTLTYYS